MTAPRDPTETLRRQEFDDLQNEIAGRETGRRARFLPGRSQMSEQERKERDARAFQTQLDLLLQDPIYRAKYEKVMERLREAERATEAALVKLDRLIEQNQIALNDMEDRAARLPDGTRVFRDANGAVRQQDGTIVEDELAATILWRGDEPSYEEWRDQSQSLAGLRIQRRETETYQNDVLGSARNRMTDEDDPPSLSELDGILGDMGAKMPDIVREELVQPDAAPTQEIEAVRIAIPTLAGKP